MKKTLSLVLILFVLSTEFCFPRGAQAIQLQHQQEPCFELYRPSIIDSIDDLEGFQKAFRNVLNGFIRLELSAEERQMLRNGNVDLLVEPLKKALSFVYFIIFYHFETRGYYEPLRIDYGCFPATFVEPQNLNVTPNQLSLLETVKRSMILIVPNLLWPTTAHADSGGGCSCCSTACNCGCQGPATGDDIGVDFSLILPTPHGSWALGGDLYSSDNPDSVLAKLQGEGSRAQFAAELEEKKKSSFLPAPPTLFGGEISFIHVNYGYKADYYGVQLTWYWP